MSFLTGEMPGTADIDCAVTIEPTLSPVAVLAGIVVVRTDLSFSPEVERTKRWQWQLSGDRTGGGATLRPLP